jgi:hypothetical protein
MISKFFAWCPSEVLIRRNCPATEGDLRCADGSADQRVDGWHVEHILGWQGIKSTKPHYYGSSIGSDSRHQEAILADLRRVLRNENLPIGVENKVPAQPVDATLF